MLHFCVAQFLNKMECNPALGVKINQPLSQEKKQAEQMIAYVKLY